MAIGEVAIHWFVSGRDDDHECEDQNQSDGGSKVSEQCDPGGVPLFEQHHGRSDDPPEVVHRQHVHDAGEHERGEGQTPAQNGEVHEGER